MNYEASIHDIRDINTEQPWSSLGWFNTIDEAVNEAKSYARANNTVDAIGVYDRNSVMVWHANVRRSL